MLFGKCSGTFALALLLLQGPGAAAVLGQFLVLAPGSTRRLPFRLLLLLGLSQSSVGDALGGLDLKKYEHPVVPSAPQPGLKQSPFLHSLGPNGFVRKNLYGDGINPCAKYAKSK